MSRPLSQKDQPGEQGPTEMITRLTSSPGRSEADSGELPQRETQPGKSESGKEHITEKSRPVEAGGWGRKRMESGSLRSWGLNIYHHFGSELPGSQGKKGNKHKSLCGQSFTKCFLVFTVSWVLGLFKSSGNRIGMRRNISLSSFRAD